MTIPGAFPKLVSGGRTNFRAGSFPWDADPVLKAESRLRTDIASICQILILGSDLSSNAPAGDRLCPHMSPIFLLNSWAYIASYGVPLVAMIDIGSMMNEV